MSCVVRYVELLLYKRLPSKNMNGSVSLLNFGFCSNYNFLVKQVISCYRHTTHTCAFHIDTTTLADGTYELVPESGSEQRELK